MFNRSEDGDRKSRGSFDQGKPDDGSRMRDGLGSIEVNSVLQGRLARGIDERGFAPQTPVKGENALVEPGFAIRPDCDRLNRKRSGRQGSGPGGRL
jgi:hypothetical protein